MREENKNSEGPRGNPRPLAREWQPLVQTFAPNKKIRRESRLDRSRNRGGRPLTGCFFEPLGGFGLRRASSSPRRMSDKVGWSFKSLSSSRVLRRLRHQELVRPILLAGSDEHLPQTLFAKSWASEPHQAGQACKQGVVRQNSNFEMIDLYTNAELFETNLLPLPPPQCWGPRRVGGVHPRTNTNTPHSLT